MTGARTGPVAARSSPVRLAASLSLWMVAGACWPFVVAVTAPVLLADLRIGAGGFGVTVAPYYLVGAVLSGPAGRLSDGWPPRRVGWLLAGLVAVALGLLVAAQGPWSLAASGVVAGGSLALTNPLTNRIASVHRVAGWVVGVKQSGVPTAAALCGVALPWLATTAGWRWAVAAVLVLPAAAVAADLAVHHLDLRGDQVPQRGTPVAGWPTRLAVYAGLMATAAGAVNVYLALYVVDELGGSPAVAGAVVSVLAVVGIAGRILWAGLGPQVVGSARILAGLALAGAAATAWLPVADLGSVWAPAALAGLSVMAWQGVGMLTLVRGEGAEVGRASAHVMRAFYGGFAVGPIGYGLLSSRVGARGAWLLPAVAAVAAALVVAGAARGGDGTPTRLVRLTRRGRSRRR